MDEPRTPPDPAQSALAALATLNSLILDAGLSKNRVQLGFTVVNRTVELVAYQRACLFDLSGKTPKLVAVSGQTQIPADSELAAVWTGLVSSLGEREKARILIPGDFSGDSLAAVRELAGRTSGLDIAWIPLSTGEGAPAGLWLERWGGQVWREQELSLLAPLGTGYAIAWDKCGRPAVNPAAWLKGLAHRRRVMAGLGLALLVLCLPVSLRVAAPCEVAAQNPFVVTAPAAGVIAEVFVTPGQHVKTGDPLFVYDKRVAMEDLKIARQQVQIIQSMLNRSNVQAFLDSKMRSEANLLELKLDQEKTRLDLAEHNWAKLDVAAETEGLAVIDDPSEWRGKPVSVGEKVLSIVDPAKTKVRIYLPIDDNVPFDPEKPVSVFLNAAPESGLHGKLAFVAQNVTVSPHGVPCVLAEADWIGAAKPPRIGLQGTAVVYGKTVPLVYWLLRKPLAIVRKTVGI